MLSVTGLLYRLYAWRLARQIRRRPVPGHVGIILDGNRRYARERGLADPGLAYGLGAEKLDDVLAWCVELGIPTLSATSYGRSDERDGELARENRLSEQESFGVTTPY